MLPLPLRGPIRTRAVGIGGMGIRDSSRVFSSISSSAEEVPRMGLTAAV